MKKLIIFFTAIVFLLNTNQVSADTAGQSAKLSGRTFSRSQTYQRTVVLRDFLMQYDSPLASHAHTFIEQAEQNNIDWKLVAAIAGVESYFGQQIPPYSYNGWGYGVYGNNVRNFASWDDGITVVSGALREDYINDWGARNVHEIGAIYAADPAWAKKVTHFMTLIENYEKNYTKQSISISL